MSRQPPWNFSNGAYRSRQFKIFVSQFLKALAEAAREAGLEF